MSIPFHNDVGAYVAHYTSADTALDLILSSNRIRLGPLAATNDPRETTMWAFAVGESGGDPPGSRVPGLEELAAKNVDFNQLVRGGLHVLCVSEDTPGSFKLDFHHRSYGRARMWAHYGGNHSGVCLVFEKSLLDRSIRDRCSPDEEVLGGKVAYEDSFDVGAGARWHRHMQSFMLSADEIREVGLQSALVRHRDAYADVLFFQKGSDWETENEYRWIVRGPGPLFVPVDVSLRGILLGCDFPPDRLAEAHRYAEMYDAHLARILWVNGQPFVQWVPYAGLTDVGYRDVVAAFRLTLPA